MQRSEALQKAEQLINEKEQKVFSRLKGLYSKALDTDQASWQSARSFLPQSYQHSYHFGQNLLSLVSMRGFNASGTFRKGDLKEDSLHQLYIHVIDAVGTFDGATARTLSVSAAQTTITSVKHNSLVIGVNSQNNTIDFGTDDVILLPTILW